VEALPARLLGGLFVSLYRVNAALFRRANAASFRRVCDVLCFARSGVLPFASCSPSFCRGQ